LADARWNDLTMTTAPAIPLALECQKKVQQLLYRGDKCTSVSFVFLSSCLV